MKACIIILLFSTITFLSCGNSDISSTIKLKENFTELNPKIDIDSAYNDFQFSYYAAGLGSNMGSKQPTLTVNGNNFVFMLKQNSSSWDGKMDLPTDTLCNGQIRYSSIDSILNLISELKDTLIYNTNPGIMSGGIFNMAITKGENTVGFKLHNGFDSTASQIINILNTNLDCSDRKLYLIYF